ncbi:MAG: hypothetical protein R3C26_25925 [Calditrichia bacterium]
MSVIRWSIRCKFPNPKPISKSERYRTGQQIPVYFPDRGNERRKPLLVMVAVASKIRDQFGAIPVIGKASQLTDELYHEVIKSNDIKIVEGNRIN